MSHRTQTKKQRNPRVEALRLVAIVGIAIFHTFQPWFEAATDGSWAASPLTLVAVGLISLLGAYGNHVFFLISGYYLLPRAASAAGGDRYWPDQARRTVRRALPILATVVVYALIALAVSTWVTPIERVSLHETSWLVGGLQFIWVYLAIVVATPVMGWIWSRVSRPRAVVAAIVVAVFAVNAYIAFVSPGSDSRSLLEWRKLMSAVSYLAAFLVGACLAEKNLSRPAALLGACGAAALLAEGVAGLTSNTWLLGALSFKSTSLVSFALAVASLSLAVARPAPEAVSRPARLVCAVTPSILGSYVAQSIFTAAWHPAMDALCADALALGGEAALLLVGIVASVVLLAGVFAFDRLVRISVLRALGLA